MAGTCMSIARLDESTVSRVQELERDLGTHLIAVEGRCHWSDLSEEQLQRLHLAEQELGVVLLAYEPD